MKKSALPHCLSIVICLLISNFGFAQNTIVKDSVATKLEEVNIIGIKKTFTTKNGTIKVDVANSILNAVPNTLDLLAKLPKITISSDREQISIVGKGTPLLYIDNQKATLNDLNALGVDDIKTIEIIHNPSSKFEAEGRAVILIVRKFSKKEGVKVDLSEVTSFKRLFNNYLGMNSSFKKNRLEWKANFNYNDLNVWESHRMNYQIPAAGISSNYNVTAVTGRPQFIFGGGLFYKINEEDYFSFSINNRMQKDIFGIDASTYNQQNNQENTVLTESDNDETRAFTNSFVNYSKKIKAINTQLFVGFQFSNFNQDISTQVANNFNQTLLEWTQNRDQKFDVAVYSGRIDLEKKFKNEMKLEIGGLHLAADARTDFKIEDLNTNSSTNYIFKEENTAAYSQLSGTLKKVSYSFGLRAENTAINGAFKKAQAPLIAKNYTNFFPKIALNFSIDSTKAIALNYAKTIVRPNYSSTSQGTAYINPYFLYGKNTNLDPTITDEIAVNFDYHDKSIRLGYYQTSHPVYGNFTFDSEHKVLTLSDKNFDKEAGFNVELNLPFAYKFWSSTNSLSFISNTITDNSAVQLAAKPYLYCYSNQTFTLPSSITVSLTAWGVTRQKEGVFERNARVILDASTSKTFFKNWICTLSFNDIFRNMIFKERFTINGVTSQSRYLTDAHEVSIAIKYSFGSIKEAQYKEKDVDENSNRIR